MAGISGRTGRVLWDGTNYDDNVGRWTMTYTQPEHDVTAFATSPPTGKTMIPGAITDWSGSFEAFPAHDVNLQIMPDAPETFEVITLRLLDAGTDYQYSGSAFVVNVEPTVSIDDSVKATIQFRGTGALTIQSPVA